MSVCKSMKIQFTDMYKIIVPVPHGYYNTMKVIRSKMIYDSMS